MWTGLFDRILSLNDIINEYLYAQSLIHMQTYKDPTSSVITVTTYNYLVHKVVGVALLLF